RLIDRNARPQAPQREQELARSRVVAVLLWLEDGRRPDLDAPVEERVEPPGHDADHLERLAAEDDLLADDVPVRSEAPLPETVAEHDDVLETLATVAGQERAAKHRGDAEDLEEVCRGIRAGQLLRLAGAGELHVPAPRDRERVEDVRALADLLVARHREPCLEVVEVRVVVVERDETLGTVVRQRAQENRVDERENRRV